LDEDLQPRFWRDDWGFPRADFSRPRSRPLKFLLEHAFARAEDAERLLRGVDEVARSERDEYRDGLNYDEVTVWDEGVVIESGPYLQERLSLDRGVFRQILVGWIEFLRTPRS
jgi:hypothetical protein